MIGNTIPLQLGAPYNQQAIGAKITQVFEPFVRSSTILVLLDSPALGLEGHMVLKLFDRRFVAELRKKERIGPWTTGIEQQYYHFVINGSASNFITKLNSNSEMAEEDGDTWNVPENEAYFHDYMTDLYKREVEVYNTLKDIQGCAIPQLFVCLTVPSSSSSPAESVNKYIEIPGILLQYIDGFPLSDIAAHAPMATWQTICDDAIQIVNLMSHRGILNKNVTTWSFIVHKSPENILQVFMKDFALCNFRREFEDEEDWREWKANQDEEGAVGYVMQKYLKGGFVYQRSALYEKLDRDFKMEG